MRKRKHIGYADEIRPAREAGTKARMLCGYSFVPTDTPQEGVPTCARCQRAATTERVLRPKPYIYKVVGIWSWPSEGASA